MKYLVVVFDGMADRPVKALGGRTPMECADKPTTDLLASSSLVGTVSNVPAGMRPESDPANLSILSYDPAVYSKGRSPLEALSMGIELSPEDTAIRCNVVTLSENAGSYEDQIMLDHSADEISTPEAAQLINTLEEKLGSSSRSFYPGVSYRHCLVWKGADDKYPLTPPHDIIGRRIGDYLPGDENGREFLSLMRESYDILKNHPVNIIRKEKGKNPANSAWLWSPGKKPALPSFEKKWGLKGTIISAVDLLKGIGICAGMNVVSVKGATGNINTDYEGKAQAAIKAFDDGYDFVYIHVEAPDECGHRGEVENKVRSIEYIDKRILKTVYEYLRAGNDDYRILILPDHPTPLELRTHTGDPVPFMIYYSDKRYDGVASLTEACAADKNLYYESGTSLISLMIKGKA